MGFSSQSKQYAPNGNGAPLNGSGCTRKVMSSVLSTMASFNSTLNSNNNSILNHFRSWQRSRRMRSLSRNSVVNPINNLCYQSMLPKSTTNLNSVSQFNCYQMNQVGFEERPTPTPVVSFMNKGEGVIAMQLVNRVMINENQLYSMHLTPPKDAENNLSDMSCYASLEPPHEKRSAIMREQEYSLNGEIWFYGCISREQAIQAVQNCATGSFVVRNSSTKDNCYALTVRVPRDHNHTGVAHYLILPTEDNRFKIKGFHKEFYTISSLIIHHSIMKEQLPCTLRLNTPSPTNCHKSVSCSQLGYNTINTINRHSPTHNSSLYSINSQKCNNIYNTYGKSCSFLNTVQDNQDLLVDVDLDPTYQKILDNFRKVMAHCN